MAQHMSKWLIDLIAGSWAISSLDPPQWPQNVLNGGSVYLYVKLQLLLQGTFPLLITS